MPAAQLLHIDNLHTHFRTGDGVVKAVDGLSLQLAAGETVGIVGESGSGKSVLSMSIMRLIATPPGYFPAGAVHFMGHDMLRLSERSLSDLRGNRVAMIFQDPMTALNPFLTVARQLTEVLERHRGVSAKVARSRAIGMLERVGIPDAARRIDAYPHAFSGGMRQRVMIAMALLCEPALLIADEPTTALDVTIAAQILALIKDLKRDFNTSVMLITHDLAVVAGMADRIVVMYAGRIVEHAPTLALYDAPQHPYTHGLLRSRPRLDGPRQTTLTPIRGLPPDLSHVPPGCPFAPRCDAATERCRQDYPERVAWGAEHWAACWHPRGAAHD